MTSFLRLFFYLLYHQFAWAYDFISGLVSVGLWKSWVISVSDYLTGPIILELGYGPGHLQKNLRSRFDSVFGIDSSHQMSFIAAKRLLKNKLDPKIINSLSQALPFPDNSFDQIVATFPSEYIVDNETTNEIGRVLKKYGVLVLLPGARLEGTKCIYRFFAWIFKVSKQVSDHKDETIKGKYIPALKKAGFVVNIENKKLHNSTIILLICNKPDGK